MPNVHVLNISTEGKEQFSTDIQILLEYIILADFIILHINKRIATVKTITRRS